MATLTEQPAEMTAAQKAIRTPRAAALAGIVFAILLITALVLVRLSVPKNPNEGGTWLSISSQRSSVLLALSLVPFAGIAFLWFIGVVRARIGTAEDQFFSTVFLGSGLLFVAMLFVAAAAAAGIVAVGKQNETDQVAREVWRFGRTVTYTVLIVYAMRMAAVFMISTSTILLRSRTVPRLLSICGYAIAAILLVTVGLFPWVELLFPLWVLILSSYILLEGTWRSRHPANAGIPGGARPNL